MNTHLRIARPVANLAQSVRMYKHGLSLEELGSFADHDGFDGVILGDRDCHYHFEFTYCRRHPVCPTPTCEDLLVFYVTGRQNWEERCMRMRDSGFTEVEPFNSYWSRLGRTFQDSDGYRVVIQRSERSNAP